VNPVAAALPSPPHPEHRSVRVATVTPPATALPRRYRPGHRRRSPRTGAPRPRRRHWNAGASMRSWPIGPPTAVTMQRPPTP